MRLGAILGMAVLAGLLCHSSFATAQTDIRRPLKVLGFDTDVIVEGPSIAPFDAVEAHSRVDTAVDGSALALRGKDWPEVGGTPNFSDQSQVSALGWPFKSAPQTQANSLFMPVAGTASLTLKHPIELDRLALLVGSTEGDTNLSLTVKYSDNSTQTANFIAKDWFVSPQTGLRLTAMSLHDGITSGRYLRVLEVDLDTKPEGVMVVGVDISRQEGNSRLFVVGLSGENPVFGVPTLTEWATLLLVIGLAGLGGIVTVRRRLAF